MITIMSQVIRTYSGRNFTEEDIENIKWTRDTYKNLSRSELAGTVCHVIEWTTPSGKAKIQQCKDFLGILEQEGIITLPPLKKRSKKKTISDISNITVTPGKALDGKVRDYEPIRLEIAETGIDLKLWRVYINEYHMLKDKGVFGSRIQYFIVSNDKKLGCIQFSASSWSLKKRDDWIGWTVEDRKKRLHLIINNSRYLIFPWVHIKNLASHVLAIAAKQVVKDWLKEYCYAPVLLETFVDLEYFKGTCYKASNWSYLGKTKGTGRSHSDIKLSKKAIYVYPLQKDFKECLRGEKPYKVVEPE
jgi:hypothetical protein